MVVSATLIAHRCHTSLADRLMPDAASVVARTPRLLEHIILCSLEDDDPVPTLIAWQLVSRACLGFARADAVWNELLSRRCYHQPMIHEPAHLYDDPVGEQLREGFQRIVAESTRRPWQAYSARSRLDKVVRDLFNGLINATSGKLSYYNTIVRVGLQGLDEIGRQLASIDASEEDWLSRRWYAHELIKSVTAHEACLWWRAIDKQESAKYAGMVKRNAYDAAFTSLAFVAGGDPESVRRRMSAHSVTETDIGCVTDPGQTRRLGPRRCLSAQVACGVAPRSCSRESCAVDSRSQR